MSRRPDPAAGPDGADWRALDLGCGSGELLLMLCQAHSLAGDGVERNASDVDRARLRASELLVADRVAFHHGDAAAWCQSADLLVNVGAGYVWGDTAQALAALRRLAAPGGKVLFADGFYRTNPSDQVRDTFGDLPDLATLARLATDAGFRPLHVSESTLAEWDDFDLTPALLPETAMLRRRQALAADHVGVALVQPEQAVGVEASVHAGEYATCRAGGNGRLPLSKPAA